MNHHAPKNRTDSTRQPSTQTASHVVVDGDEQQVTAFRPDNLITPTFSPRNVAQLQRQIGNAATQRLMAKRQPPQISKNPGSFLQRMQITVQNLEANPIPDQQPINNGQANIALQQPASLTIDTADGFTTNEQKLAQLTGQLLLSAFESLAEEITKQYNLALEAVEGGNQAQAQAIYNDIRKALRLLKYIKDRAVNKLVQEALEAQQDAKKKDDKQANADYRDSWWSAILGTGSVALGAISTLFRDYLTSSSPVQYTLSMISGLNSALFNTTMVALETTMTILASQNLTDTSNPQFQSAFNSTFGEQFQSVAETNGDLMTLEQNSGGGMDYLKLAFDLAAILLTLVGGAILVRRSVRAANWSKESYTNSQRSEYTNQLGVGGQNGYEVTITRLEKYPTEIADSYNAQFNANITAPVVLPQQNVVVPQQNNVVPQQNGLSSSSDSLSSSQNGVLPQQNDLSSSSDSLSSSQNVAVPQQNVVVPQQNDLSSSSDSLSSSQDDIPQQNVPVNNAPVLPQNNQQDSSSSSSEYDSD